MQDGTKMPNETPLVKGQIWVRNTTQEPFFVTGVREGWVWYTRLSRKPVWDPGLGPQRMITGPQPWSKSKEQHFINTHTFTKHAIATRSYWKKKATGEVVQVISVKDDGWDVVQVYYDLLKCDLRTFYNYFEPCTRAEYIMFIAKEEQENRKAQEIREKTPQLPAEEAEL